MGNCCGCCELPESTKVKIKICFVRSSLAECTATTNDYPTFSNSISPGSPDIGFETTVNAGCNYLDFLYNIRDQLAAKPYGIYLNDSFFNDKTRFIRYQTCKDGLLKTFSLPYDKKFANITFNWLFYNLSFLDWNQLGYSLILWFDECEFKTRLDLTSNEKEIHDILSNRLRFMIEKAISRDKNGDMLDESIVGEVAPRLSHAIEDKMNGIFGNDPQMLMEGHSGYTHSGYTIEDCPIASIGSTSSSSAAVAGAESVAQVAHGMMARKAGSGYSRLVNDCETENGKSMIKDCYIEDMRPLTRDLDNYLFSIKYHDLLNLLLINNFEISKCVAWYIDSINELNKIFCKCSMFWSNWKECELILQCIENVCLNSLNVLVASNYQFDWIWKYKCCFSPFEAILMENNDMSEQQCYLLSLNGLWSIEQLDFDKEKMWKKTTIDSSKANAIVRGKSIRQHQIEQALSSKFKNAYQIVSQIEMFEIGDWLYFEQYLKNVVKPAL